MKSSHSQPVEPFTLHRLFHGQQTSRYSWRLEVPAGLSTLARMPAADPRFNEFVILQAQNAGLFLGQIPHPGTGEKSLNLRAAKSVIDSLEMLVAKTQGNLTETEEKLLSTALANLRPLYEKAVG